jgi:hypothetical protein
MWYGKDLTYTDVRIALEELAEEFEGQRMKRIKELIQELKNDQNGEVK